MKKYLFIVISGFFGLLHAQIIDDFSDGDLTTNPRWLFNSGDFVISNSKLKSNNSSSTAKIFSIYTQHKSTVVEIWEAEVEMGFNPSSQNYVEYFLNSDSAPSSAKNALFVKMGNTKDEISLYQMINGNPIEIISGADGALNRSTNYIFIRVKKVADTFFLFRKLAVTDTFFLEGKVTLPTFSIGNYAGFNISQTSSNSTKHQFDNVYIGKEIKDTIAPKIIAVNFIKPNTLVTNSNEIVINSDTNNYFVPGIGKPFKTLISGNSITLFFKNNFKLNTVYNLQTTNLTDAAGNKSKLQFFLFNTIVYDTAKIGDIIFTEIMAKPTGSNGTLPNAEYVELYNRTSKFININNCKLLDKTSSYKLPDSIIKPYEYFVLSKNTFNAFQVFGKWVGMSSFPTLNDDADLLTFTNQFGENIHQVNYSENWHTDGLKRSGGWSLEMVDTNYYCVEENNWKSNNTNGGTPSHYNSVTNAITPKIFNAITHIFPINSTTINVYFYQKLQDTFNSMQNNFELNTGEKPVLAKFLFDQKNIVQLQFANSFVKNTIYMLKANGLKNCFGAKLSINGKTFGLPEKTIDSGQVLINELLFNPKTNGSDFLELYNNSDKILDLQYLLICNTDENGNIKDVYKAHDSGYLLMPHQYIAVSIDTLNISNNYPKNNVKNLFQIKAMPAYNDDKGTVFLVTSGSKILDKFSYSDNMHSALIANVEGISLEKINPTFASNTPSYWHSAAEASGFATPGFENSFLISSTSNASFSLVNNVVSPNGDGNADNLILQYHELEKNSILTVIIFNEFGKKIITPIQNFTSNTSGSIVIDLVDKGVKFGIGNYVLWIQSINENGTLIKKKITFTVVPQ